MKKSNVLLVIAFLSLILSIVTSSCSNCEEYQTEETVKNSVQLDYWVEIDKGCYVTYAEQALWPLTEYEKAFCDSLKM